MCPWFNLFSSVAQLCPTPWDLMDCITPGLAVHHQLLEFTQTHVHWVGDAIQPSHPLSSPSPTFNLSQHQGLFQWASSSHQVAQVLELQLQHQFFQWIFSLLSHFKYVYSSFLICQVFSVYHYLLLTLHSCSPLFWLQKQTHSSSLRLRNENVHLHSPCLF